VVVVPRRRLVVVIPVTHHNHNTVNHRHNSRSMVEDKATILMLAPQHPHHHPLKWEYPSPKELHPADR